MTSLTYAGVLVTTTCWCGIHCAIPSGLYRAMQSDSNQGAYCPIGHQFFYTQNEATRLRAELDQAKADARWQREQTDRARRDADHQAARARGYKGAMVQTKKRAAKGVCPVPGCKRHFVDVQRHVASKHPDWAAERAS